MATTTTKKERTSVRRSKVRNFMTRIHPQGETDRQYWGQVVIGLAVGVVMFIALTAATLQDRAQITFPSSAATIVTVATLILLALPAWSACRSKNWAQLVYMAILVIVTYFALLFGLRLAGMLGVSQWYWAIGASAWVVGFLLLLLPIVLTCWLPFRMATLQRANPETESKRKASDAAKKKHAKAETRLEVIKGEAAEANVAVEKAQKRHDKAAAKAKKLSEKYTDTEKAAKNDPKVRAEQAAKSNLDGLLENLADIEAQISRDRAELEAESDEVKRKALQGQIEMNELEVVAIKKKISQARRDLAEAQKATKDLPLVRDREAARAASENASEQEATTRENLTAAKAHLRIKNDEVGRLGKRFKKLDTEVKTNESTLGESEKKDVETSKTWRLKTALLLLASLLAYASWGGLAILG